MITAMATEAAQLATPSTVTGTSEVESANVSVEAEVKRWQSRIKKSKAKYKPDFERMRKNMEFVTGLQWQGQQVIDDERYTNNITLRLVNQKVATLYAKNPTVEATRRPRMDYQLWSGDRNEIIMAMMQAQEYTAMGLPVPPPIMALIMDFENGTKMKMMVDKVCDTLEKLFAIQIDSQRPEFKEQVKQAVRRTIICGVAYCRPIFCREGYESYVSSIDSGSTEQDRIGRAKVIMDRIASGEIDNTSADLATLQQLLQSVGVSQAQGDSATSSDAPVERLEFDFPTATSIIVDENCRNLKEFVACRWIAQEYILPVDEVNALFGTDIKVGTGGEGQAIDYTQAGEAPRQGSTPADAQVDKDPFYKGQVALWEVYDYNAKNRFFIVDGWKDYVVAPEPTISVSGFWHHFALTFNDIESDVNTKASIYPPSDVQLVKSPQKEWNRTREALRDQRNANAPKYPVRKGLLTQEDKEKLMNATPNSVIELEGVPADTKPNDLILPMQVAQINPANYDTNPLSQDMMLTAGLQEANIGNAPSNVTATVGTIAEQSRMTVAASNIDDLDGWLSRIAQCGGEMLLKEMSPQTVQELVGMGSVWPTLPQSKAMFSKQIYLKIKAASSGRPNKAIDVANWRDLAPLLLQSGANPIGIIEETAKRIDDNLDIDQFFPISLPSQPGEGSGEQQPPASSKGASSTPGGGPPSGPSTQLPMAGPSGNGQAPLAAATRPSPQGIERMYAESGQAR